MEGQLSDTLSCEELEARLVALHRASLELVQDISLDSLLERIASIACEQAGASYAAVGVLGDDDKLERFISVGMAPEEVAAMAHPPVGKGLIGALMKSQQTIHVSDISSDPRSVGFPKHHPVMTNFLGVPIRQGELQLGQIYITNKKEGLDFSEDDQRVIEMLASYAAVAISNARLYKELVQRDQTLTRRNENLALLNQLASTLATATEPDQILNQALTQVMEYLRLEVGEIYLRRENSKVLHLVLHRGELASALWASDEYGMGQGVVGLTAKTGQPQLLVIPGKDGRELHPSLDLSCFKQIACFPLTGRKGSLGVLCVASCNSAPLDELEMQFLSAISAWVGTALENVQLSLQGKRLAILEERERIGMDLHDGIIQSIYAVGLTLENVRSLLDEDPDQARQRIDQAIKDLNDAIRDIRAYILDLRPRYLGDENLMQGVKRLVHEFRANTLLDVNLQGPEDGVEKLAPAQALALFHICQEALANIAKHARARHVDVVVWTSGDRALLEVKDDGSGFDAEAVKTTIGHGLSNMQTRAHNAGGEIDITTEPGSGTSVMAWVPFKEEE